MEKPITIKGDDVFSEPRTAVSEPPRQLPVMEARPALCSIENFQNFENSAARFVNNLIVVLCFVT